ncbi:MAG: tripartite tricarboxylate transporter substrate binding protein [Betaproteobacteria bacterium]|nr:tripartite tricarboxylate transporter substrate binding protein [Betaproteobacteria bacterium]
MRNIMRNALLSVLMLFGASPCFGAEVYPSKPVRVIVTAAPGGVVDVTARVISRQLSEQFGKQFIVEQRTGADGIIGVGFVAKSAPDGYRLLLSSPNFTILPGFNKSLPYDPVKDFTPITQIIGNTQVLVVPLSLKANTLKEFVALAQANPGKFNYGSGGPGSPLHLYSVLFSKAAKIDIVHIPYKGGGGDPILGMLAGEIQMLFASIPTALPKVRSGMARALAVTTDGKRLPSMPDVPSMSKAGVSGMIVNAAYGFIGPAGMPKEVVNKLHAEVVKALAVPSVKAQYAAQEAELVGSSPEEYSELLRNELRRWDEVIKSAGITK